MFDVIKNFRLSIFFFFNDTATTEIYTLSLHDALPISEFSEPNGYFRADNFVSNETTFQYVIRELKKVTPGGVYLGVGPDQNFTYVVAMRPKIAIIFDIRRQNMLQHLMYKALIEMSSDRADFISRLFSRKRPEGLEL